MFACTRLYKGINMADNHSLPDLLMEPRESQSLLFSGHFAKFCACGSCGSKRETAMESKKILQTEVGKVWRECGFLNAMCSLRLR